MSWPSSATVSEQITTGMSPVTPRILLITSGVASLMRSAAIKTLDRGLIPGRRIPWLTVSFDSFLHVTSEILIHDSVRAASFERGDHLGDHPAFHHRRFNNRDSAIFSFDDDLHALLNLLQHSVQVASDLI